MLRTLYAKYNVFPLAAPIIPYNNYKLPYNYYPFLREFSNATKHYQPRRIGSGTYQGLPAKGHNWDILHVRGLTKKSF
jgi:hypothetical protein